MTAAPENTTAPAAAAPTYSVKVDDVVYTDLASVQNKFFKASNLLAAVPHMVAVEGIPDITIYTNLPPRDENFAVPDGFGIIILPVAKRENNTNVRFAVAIAAVPGIDNLTAAGATGLDYIERAVMQKFEQQISAAIRPLKDGDANEPIELPRTLEDFISTSGRGRKGDTTFTTIAKDILAMLRGNKIILTPAMLRNVLSSAAYAEAHYAKAEAKGDWVRILEAMITMAKQKGLDTTTLEHMKATRNQEQFTDGELDMSALDKLVAAAAPKPAEGAQPPA